MSNQHFHQNFQVLYPILIQLRINNSCCVLNQRVGQITQQNFQQLLIEVTAKYGSIISQIHPILAPINQIQIQSVNSNNNIQLFFNNGQQTNTQGFLNLNIQPSILLPSDLAISIQFPQYSASKPSMNYVNNPVNCFLNQVKFQVEVKLNFNFSIFFYSKLEISIFLVFQMIKTN
ncbi:hypothetical protein ABPG72_010679 [Tetrahymena utriculariae]